MATGQTLLTLQAVDSVPAASNGAAFKAANNRLIAGFDPSTQQSADFACLMPQNFAATTGVTVYLDWFGDTATTGNCVWSVAFERNAAGGNAVTSDNFATAVQASAAAVNGTLGKLTQTSVALTTGTQMNSTVAGDEFRIRVARVAADAGDTMSGNANLLAVEIRET